MWLSKLTMLVFLTMPVVGFTAEKVGCPASLKEKNNVLVGARLFDGAPSDQAELVPDNQNGATWNISGYIDSDRDIYLVCDYKNGESINLVARKFFRRCYVTGKKRVSAWCGK